MKAHFMICTYNYDNYYGMTSLFLGTKNVTIQTFKRKFFDDTHEIIEYETSENRNLEGNRQFTFDALFQCHFTLQRKHICREHVDRSFND